MNQVRNDGVPTNPVDGTAYTLDGITHRAN